MLTDAGPLVAILYRRDASHQKCASYVSQRSSVQLVTPWACFGEAMYLLGRIKGRLGRHELWQMVKTKRLQIHAADPTEIEQMADLMDKYSDLPMDLGDASLMAAAEALGERRIFTLDQHFHVYRFADGSAVDVVP